MALQLCSTPTLHSALFDAAFIQLRSTPPSFSSVRRLHSALFGASTFNSARRRRLALLELPVTVERGWKVDQHGLVELNYRKRFSKYEPFALAQQAQQVYFVEWASKKRDRNDWWVVCKIQARSMINVPEVVYQEDEICEQYEASIDDEDVNLCGGVGMARGKGRGTIGRVGRGGRFAVQNDGGSACSRLRKGRSLSQSGGSFNDEIEETPIEVPMQDGDGGNHVEEYVHQPTSNDHSNNGVPSCTETQQTDTTQIPQSNTTQTQQTKTKQLRKSPDGRIYIEPSDNSFV
ncbi:pheromone-processing carboxypeptidase KEX1-like [Senna tora]|uniref:Pheromone-processing carboxypeptidase KEX1-like n=1 Tax=Senna tora TaxID=362788 RepID=A0A834SDB6_9FABA|nr:pheromone-processing carboxypeptidase KEX1-like [Senna tora]